MDVIEPMINEYLNDEEDVCSWFGGPWKTLEALEIWSENKHEWDRPQLCSILKSAAKSYSASPATIDNIKLLKNDDCYAVITGQQPSVGGGPLYTLIKTAHAIALSQQLRATGCKVVPIFWCASEDHDEGEANHADFITRNGSVQRFSSSFQATGASSQYQKAIHWWQDLLIGCENICGPGLGKDFFTALEPTADESLGTWQCRLMSKVFAEHGLICLEAHQLRPLWHSQLSNIVDHWPRLALAHQRKQVMDHGFKDSFNGLLSHPPLFLDRPQGRSSIMDMDARQMHAWSHNLHVDDRSISSGAALRPIIQQLCIPGMAYVGGPGELHYHAFLSPLYR